MENETEGWPPWKPRPVTPTKKVHFFVYDVFNFVILGMLCLGGWYGYHKYEEYETGRRAEQARIQQERERKKRQEAERRAAREQERREARRLARERALEKARAERERRAAERERAEAERLRAEAQAKAERKRQEEERRRIEAEAAQRRAEEWEVRQRQLKKMKEAERLKTIAEAARTYKEAQKKIYDAERRKFGAIRKLTAFKNRLTGARKSAFVQGKNEEKLRSIHGREAGGAWRALGLTVWNMSDYIATARMKKNISEKEIQWCSDGIKKSQTDLQQAENDLAEAKRQKEQSRATLKILGAPDDILRPRQKPKAPVKRVTIYVLKDGRHIRAVNAVKLGDQWSLKDETGKFIVVKKADVVKIEKPE